MPVVRPKPKRRKWAQNAAARGDEPKAFWNLLGFRLSALALLLCGLIIALSWFWNSGIIQREAAEGTRAFFEMTKEAGFAVRAIDVHGRKQTSDAELFGALKIKMNAPLLASDLEEARARIEKLPWVASATLERRLPDILFITLVEREPLARWQQAGKNVVVDKEGKILPSAKAESFSTLPLVVGQGAATEASGLLESLKEYPYVAERLEASVRVGERRWDLHMKDHVIVKMPEKDLKNGLLRLSDLMQSGQLIDRDVVAIDLRLADKIIFERGDEKPPEKTPPKKTGNQKR